LSLLYKVESNPDSTNSFVTDNGDIYSAFFTEYQLLDADGNVHLAYNFVFLCNERFDRESFSRKYDPKIRNTLVKLISDFFIKNDHSSLLYFCFDDDGLSRNRNIVFKTWCKDLSPAIYRCHKAIPYQSNSLYSSLLVVNENPLKELIVDAYESHLREMALLMEK